MTQSDEILIQRLLDGELPEPEARALRERLANDPRLRKMANEQRLVTRWFEEAAGAADAAGTPVPVGFAGRVVSRLKERPFDRPVPILVFTRRIALAAAVLLGVTLVWHFALSGRLAGGQMQAGPPNEVKEAVDQLRIVPLPEDVAGRLSPQPATRQPVAPQAGSRPASTPGSSTEATGRGK